MKEFKKKYNLEQRKQKSLKQITQNPGKVPIIAQPHPKSKLQPLKNSKFLCEEHYKFNAVCTILSKKIQKTGPNLQKQSKLALFIFVNKNLVHGEESITNIYKKFKDQDGFLYVTYGEMEAFG